MLNIAEKFDLNRKNWTILADFPMPICTTNAVLANNNFVICGSSNEIYFYNISQNYYEILTPIIQGSFLCPGKVLIKEFDKFYLLDGTSIYISHSNNLNEWNKHDKLLAINMMPSISKPVIRGRKAYFYDYRLQVHQFDLDSFDLRIIN